MVGTQRAFPIREADGETKMKNISPSALPHFHGITFEDPDTFIFEFFVVCRTYDYTSDDQKLKLFPSTLNDAALRWFMSLPGDNITTWAQMEETSTTNIETTVGPRKLKMKYLG